MDKQAVLEEIKEGSAALDQQRYQDAARHLLVASRGLYESVESGNPATRSLRIRQAEALKERGLKLMKYQNVEKSTASAAAQDESSGGIQYKEIPKLNFSNIAGAKVLKDTMQRKIIAPLQKAERAKRLGIRPSSGVLMYGPPGTGKTFFAEALAGELQCPFYEIKSEQIFNKYHGESEKALAEIFETAAQHPLSVLFFDEIDAILPNRDSGQSSNVSNSIINVFLRHATQHKNILMIGATNRPWAVDPSALRPERFETLIEVPLPDLESRHAILVHLAEGKDFSKDIDWWHIAEITDRYSVADLVAYLNAVGQAVFMEIIEKDVDRQIETRDLENGLKDVPPSVTQKQLDQIERYKASNK